MIPPNCEAFKKSVLRIQNFHVPLLFLGLSIKGAAGFFKGNPPRRADSAEKFCVMADGDEGAAIGVQRIFHRLDRFDVEMVDRFIQKQKLGRVLAADGAGERGAQPLPARKHGRRQPRCLVAEMEAGECRIGRVIGCAGIEAVKIVDQAGPEIEDRRRLVEIGEPDRAADLARRGGELTGDQPSSVVFPAPFGPSSATRSAPVRVREKASMTRGFCGGPPVSSSMDSTILPREAPCR